VALVAPRGTLECTIHVTTVAFQPSVLVVELLSGDGVVEVGRRPSAVTGVAVRIRSTVRNRLVARTAALLGVIALQRPAGAGVIERGRRRLSFLNMTTVARRRPMAVEAGLMVLFEGADMLGMLFAPFVAAFAVIFAVTIGATQVVVTDVRLMTEENASR